MLSYLLIFFSISEIFLLTKGGLFWLIVVLIFSVFCFRKFVHPDLKRFWILFPPVLLVFISFLLLKFLDVSVGIGQVFLLILLGFFYAILRFYADFKLFGYVLNALMMLIAGIMSFLFFRADVLQEFFGKEIFLFLCLLFLFEADRNVAPIFIKNDNGEEKNDTTGLRLAYVVIPSLILVEFFWLLNLWPINIVSLVGIWLGVFYLIREFVFLSFKKDFHWKTFWPQVVLTIVLVFLLMMSASWMVV